MGGAASITQDNLDRMSLQIINGKTVKNCAGCDEWKELTHSFGDWYLDNNSIMMNCKECIFKKKIYKARKLYFKSSNDNNIKRLLYNSMEKWKLAVRRKRNSSKRLRFSNLPPLYPVDQVYTIDHDDPLNNPPNSPIEPNSKKQCIDTNINTITNTNTFEDTRPNCYELMPNGQYKKISWDDCLSNPFMN